MAEGPAKKKPRIRKAPQTMREKTQSSVNAETKKRGVVSRAASKVKKPLKVVAKPVKTVNAKRPKVKIPSNRVTMIVGKILRPFWRAITWIPRYIRSAWREVKLVTWPSRTETIRLTFAVFVFAVVFGAAAFAVDHMLDNLFKRFVLK